MAIIKTTQRLRELIPESSATAFAKIRDELCDQGTQFVANCPFLVLATTGSWGIEVSPKGDQPGFIEVWDRKTLVIPERKGNQFALSLGNIIADERVGLLLIRPATDEVLRISGRAALDDDPDLCMRLSANGRPATLAIKVSIERAAFHCVRSARRAGLWDPTTWSDPTRISFGQIYAEALEKPEVRELFDDLTEKSNSSLY